ncbi:uridine kinase [Streptomyces sp. TR06-5]|uniref:uridine kinase family protein n=1 Tax=unclassified Streptomyces TaxID=2593676 RepID=UPI0039A05BFC
MDRPDALAALARHLRTLPASCGPVRLIGIDGHAGSGKSTLARRLAGTLGGAPVVHLDDVASHDRLFDWTDRLAAQVVGPLSQGERARLGVYDWERRVFDGTVEVPPAEAVLVEGVGAGRSALRPFLAALLWLDVPEEVAWARGRSRDGAALAEFWDGWTGAERAHFRRDPSYPRADYLVRPGTVGYEVRPGPAGPGSDPPGHDPR